MEPFLFSKRFPYFIEFFQPCLNLFFLFVEFHEAGDIGKDFFPGEKPVDFAVPRLQLVNLILSLL